MGRPLNNKNATVKELLLRPEMTMLFVLIGFCLIMAFASPVFLTSKNLMNILRQIAVYSILGVGEAFIIITGGIDLSVGSQIGWTACVGGVLAQAGFGPLPMLLCVLAAGLLPGLVNGFMITRVGLPPFIATLGMLSVANGMALVITDGFPIHYEGTWLSSLGGGYTGMVPNSVIITVVIVFLGYIVSKYTVFGRNIYAIGNSEKAANLSGIKVKNVKTAVYGLTGVLAGVCGIIQIGLLNGADASYGKGAELDVIAAAVIGGISMSGGEGNILGVFVGAGIMGVLRNAFILLNVSGYTQIVALGIVIIAAVSVDSLRRKNRAA